ncbi:MAG: alkaline phosphatase family protein [Chitinophagaceae bacterium]|nr:alkaline phosphatase family protein [Chitinophagaceae bacterium]
MKIKSSIVIFSLLISITVTAQNKKGLVSGPWAGNVELRTATIWVEVTPGVKAVSVKYYAGNAASAKTVLYRGELGKDFNPVKIELNGLDMNTTYTYTVVVDGKAVSPGFITKFTTKDLWQWRKPAPDFSFLTGSCAYFNEPQYDRPGKPYGGDSSIFETMANTPAAFHVWLGDNWYTREVDYSTRWGLNYRASHDRSTSVLQKFMASMPQYSIWDDHDYGPNDQGKSYILKDESRRIFMNYSCNPSYGQKGEGIYSVISFADVDIFLTDDRYFRSEDDMADSANGQPNPEKTYFGRMQMDWLKNALLYSNATFKVIATGGQILNPYSSFECMKYYSAEYNELMNFLATDKIKGVLFFTGDRHHSEVIRQERTGLYPLYDVTNSPYTSGVGKVRGEELNNPARMPGTLVEAQNFTRVTVSGKKNERVMKIEFLGVKGEKLGEWSVGESELK